ncbi:energy transducer TonB [Alterisphingorhabdus coralli]|uniref:Energy transducer TonB n=1 Tax=Alterisphingorhabdus coralli TaxID=3071408 RepID=A0AA97HZL6_9SPHN|nr:energy transducer TonB [Parasphingorhabdus sp. SCSIO 66989]WOE74854.1 energy transducer TonB [Parasphingorhabdus sp. SCSIO 66989]
MAYVDQDMTGNRIVSAIIVALTMVALTYALIKGFEVVTGKKILDTTEVIDIEEEVPEPEEEEPPPEPEKQAEPPPIVTPPPPIQLPAPPPPIQTQQEIPDSFVPTEQAAPVPDPGPAAPPPPPPPVSKRPNPEPRNNRGSWANTNDYPSRALREGREGTTRVRLTVGANGRVSDCAVTGSSGHSDLDAATCKNVKRRARFRPALDPQDNPITGTYPFAVRWQIPQ